MEQPKIIGISGTNGSGKDTLAQILVDVYGWLFVSVSDILRAELNQRGLPIERENLRALSAQWRREHSLGYLMDKAVEAYQAQPDKPDGLVISSLRNFGEADRIHQLGGQVVWVDAPPRLRYKRIYSRQRSTEDSKTFEQFKAEEQAEMYQAGDQATLSVSAVKAKADIFITNDSNSMDELKQIVGDALKNVI